MSSKRCVAGVWIQSEWGFLCNTSREGSDDDDDDNDDELMLMVDGMMMVMEIFVMSIIRVLLSQWIMCTKSISSQMSIDALDRYPRSTLDRPSIDNRSIDTPLTLQMTLNRHFIDILVESTDICRHHSECRSKLSSLLSLDRLSTYCQLSVNQDVD